MVTRPSPCAGTTPSAPRLSYKFQRLREQIRAAIASGEFAGQLPGERELGRRFAANAKTINKALCDLSSEGLLIRRIGRGTFVAPRNGPAAESTGARSCVVMIPTEPEPRCGRDALLHELRRILEDKGASLQLVPSDRLVDGRIPLAGWPSDRRRRTAAVACFPIDPLSGGRGHLSEDCILESYRRHIPAVVIGALSRSARVSAVAPDYSDAGLRLAEHLFQSGCRDVVVVTSGEAREAEMVAAGARAAGIRNGRSATQVVLNGGTVGDHLPIAPMRKSHDPAVSPTGILCVGTTALEAMCTDEPLRRRVADGTLLLAGVTEPGDGAPDRLGITSYEVRPQRIAEWAARLLVESRSGERPLEILIVGDVKIRESHRPQNGKSGAPPRRSGGRHRAARCETGIV